MNVTWVNVSHGERGGLGEFLLAHAGFTARFPQEHLLWRGDARKFACLGLSKRIADARYRTAVASTPSERQPRRGI